MVVPGPGAGSVAPLPGFRTWNTFLQEVQRTRTPRSVTFSSAIRNFAKIHGTDQIVDLLKNTVVATIGPVTADAARQLGIAVTIQPKTYTVPALVDAIAAHYAATTTTKTA